MVPFMKTRPMQVDDRIVHAALRGSFIDAVAGNAGLEVGGAQDAAGAFVAVGGDRVEVVDQFALVPDVVAGGENVGAQVEDFLGNLRGDAEAAGGVFGVDDGEVDGVRLADVADVLADDFASRAAEDVADEKDVQGVLRVRTSLDAGSQRSQLLHAKDAIGFQLVNQVSKSRPGTRLLICSLT